MVRGYRFMAQAEKILKEQARDMGMDKVDEGQQIEIVRLQQENKAQERHLKMLTGGLTLIVALFLISIMVTVMALQRKTDFWCPHDDCPHSYKSTHRDAQ